jgi:hypothetical protein
MKRSDLVEICKKYNISASGTKEVLLKRIEKAKFFERHSPSTKFILHPLHDDLYIHVSKNLVIDKAKNQVVGKLDNIHDVVQPLTKSDIQVCKELKLDYKMPVSLIGELQTHRIKTDLEFDSDEDDEILG